MQSRGRGMLPANKPRGEPDRLINRAQMIGIAWQHNLRVSRSTMHRWASEPGFPMAVGIDGQALLYSRSQFIEFIERKLRKIQEGA